MTENGRPISTVRVQVELHPRGGPAVIELSCSEWVIPLRGESRQDLLETIQGWAELVQNAIDNEKYEHMDDALSDVLQTLNLRIDDDAMLQLSRGLVDKGVTPP